MKKYEIMVIFTNELKESEVSKQTGSSVTGRIKEAGGNITFEDLWGARGFAYMIKKQKWGYYFVAQFEIDPIKLEELKKDWNLDNKILRFLVSTVDLKAPAPTKYADLQAKYEKERKSQKVVEEKKEAKETTPSGREKLSTIKTVADNKKAEEKSEAAPKETKKVAKKDDVDKKLDDIINDSSLDL